MGYEEITIKTIMAKDVKQGGLSFVESNRDIPFLIKRFYCIFETEKGMQRGFHAHKENIQLLYCPYGSVEIIIDDGNEKSSVCLNSPSKGLILYPGVWREMIWNKTGSILCVAASEYYDPDEYIRDYNEFKKFIEENK